MKKLCFASTLVLSYALSLATPHELKISSQSGGTYKVEKNSLITVVLDGNPSTGYSWNLDTKLALLKLVGTKTESTQKDPRLAGAPAKISFTFKALKAGTEKISLRYYRVWEKKSDNDKTWTATVVVKNATKPAKPAKK